MERTFVIVGFSVLTLLVILGLYNYQSAYQFLPVAPSSSLIEEEQEGWHEYENQNSGFGAQFPNLPLYTEENTTDPSTGELRLYKMHVSETPDGKVYMVTVVTFNDSSYVNGDLALMRRFVSELTSQKDRGSLDKLEETTFQNRPAIEFTLRNQEIEMEGLVFMEGKKLYLLSELAPYSLKLDQFKRLKDHFYLMENPQ